jgi:deoxyhypusine synthase
MDPIPNQVPSKATEAVLVHSHPMPEGSETVKGYDFNQGVDHHELLKTFKYSGFQATNFGLAVDEINKMVS